MTNQEILTKAIEKAVAGGWKKPDMPFEIDLSGEIYFEREVIRLWDDWIDIEHVIFSHDFAKALWGEKQVIFTQRDFREGRTLGDNALPAYLYHLQQMVIAEDPIKYLGENI